MAKEPLTKEQRELAAKHVKLAEKIAMKRNNPYVPPEDRLQDAYMGLIDAARDFDSGRGVKFETYAGHRILGAILDAERESYSLIRVHRKALADGARTPSVVFAGGLFPGKIPGEAAEKMNPADLLFVAPEPRVTLEDADAIDTALECLNGAEWYAAKRRFGEGATLKETALELGLSEGRISQMMPFIADRLRSHPALADYAKGA